MIVTIKDLGRIEYSAALELQEKFREQRILDQIPNTLLLAEHPPVYTIGKDLADEHKLINGSLPAPLFRINRGGKITYHGPGQLLGYFIWKIPLRQIGDFVNAVEELTLSLIMERGINAYSRKAEIDAYGKNIRGAWCTLNGEHKKIAAQGIETKSAGVDYKGNRQLVTMHGFALNISTDLQYFRHINACGFPYMVMTSMEEVLGKEKTPNYESVKKQCEKKIKKNFASFLA